jgi:hypothetical protein
MLPPHPIRKKKKMSFFFSQPASAPHENKSKIISWLEDPGPQAGSTGKINPPDLGSSDAGSANRIRSSSSLSTLFRLDLATKTKNGGHYTEVTPRPEICRD